jgi:hypothetical protein
MWLSQNVNARYAILSSQRDFVKWYVNYLSINSLNWLLLDFVAGVDIGINKQIKNQAYG